MLAFRGFMTLLSIFVVLMLWQVMTATKATTRLRGEAIRLWAAESELRKAYGEAVIDDCGAGLSVFLERRAKAVDPRLKTCVELLARNGTAQQIGLTPEDLALLEAEIDAAYAKNPFPAPLKWL